MRVYLAGNFENRAFLQGVKQAIELACPHIYINSPWLSTQELEKVDELIALRDIEEIEASALLLLDSHDATVRGGREVEVGLALGKPIPVWVVGPRRNVFHHLCVRFDTWEDVTHELSLFDEHGYFNIEDARTGAYVINVKM